MVSQLSWQHTDLTCTSANMLLSKLNMVKQPIALLHPGKEPSTRTTPHTLHKVWTPGGHWHAECKWWPPPERLFLFSIITGGKSSWSTCLFFFHPHKEYILAAKTLPFCTQHPKPFVSLQTCCRGDFGQKFRQHNTSERNASVTAPHTAKSKSCYQWWINTWAKAVLSLATSFSFCPQKACRSSLTKKKGSHEAGQPLMLSHSRKVTEVKLLHFGTSLDN